MSRPKIAISTGDPSGIGPEITLKALSLEEVYQRCKPVVICDADILNQALKQLQLPLTLNKITEPESGKYIHGIIDVIDVKLSNLSTFMMGRVSEAAGKAAFENVKKVIELALENKVDATVTGPINKEAIHKAGFKFAGHTEIYAHYTGSSKYAMMLAEGSFRVIHVNTHVSMLDAIKGITKERVLSIIRLAHETLQTLGIQKPRIAVNGLNPHAGENGLFGTEEIDHIIPAIQKAQQEGIRADGPHPSDTIFPKMKGGQYDIVVCMYHDQGHIPVKLLGFRFNQQKNVWEGLSGINVTLGLPIIRVSVDHGTAFEIAGKGVANSESMLQAIHYAVLLAMKNS